MTNENSLLEDNNSSVPENTSLEQPGADDYKKETKEPTAKGKSVKKKAPENPSSEKGLPELKKSTLETAKKSSEKAIEKKKQNQEPAVKMKKAAAETSADFNQPEIKKPVIKKQPEAKKQPAVKKSSLKKSSEVAEQSLVDLQPEVVNETKYAKDENVFEKGSKPEENQESAILQDNENQNEVKVAGASEELTSQTNESKSNDIKSRLTKITFQIKYSTKIGQSIFVTGNHLLLGNSHQQNAFPLSYFNEEYWFATLEIPEETNFTEDISYYYFVKNDDGLITPEWEADKKIPFFAFQKEELYLTDSWNASGLIQNTFYTEPFQQVLLKGNIVEVDTPQAENVTHVFKAKAPLLSKGQALCIIGSAKALGGWNTEKPLLLSQTKGDEWHSVTIDLSATDFPFTYKYGVFDTVTNTFSRYEDGKNRVLYNNTATGKLTVVSDGFAVLPFNSFKGAGVAIPVFSLRSEKSFGVGEFTDLKLLADWGKQVGMKLIQILPVNDTTATHSFTDSYPYAAISAFALHPLYLHLPGLVTKQEQSILDSFLEKQKELNSKPEVDYVAVLGVKWAFIKQIFPVKKQTVFVDNDFQEFFSENAHWLVPYAAFSYFREKYNTPDFNKWPNYQVFKAEEINELASKPMEADEEISLYYFVQYHLHLQLKEATAYAHEKGIIVKGDIPIGIYRDSCDAWQAPGFFNMNMQAGAPPDDFAVKGQNWGFPTYNWQRMREDGFSWWKKRFKQMSYYFDAFRIDHILGFFRIWSIPMNAVEGIMGHFVPAVPVSINEFAEKGILFDRERFCKPFINDAILSEIFDRDAAIVKAEFLEASSGATFRLKDEFDTQRKVESYFASLPSSSQNLKIKEGLFNLLSNVVLFTEENNKDQFHFRISVESTSSFRQFDSYTQYLLKELYVNYFFRRQDDFWRKEAMLKLPELKRSTNMLICGEDLGMVPDCVPGVMKELAILSLEIQRMPKNPLQEFFHPNDAPYLSVVTPSTHDMSTIRGWWEEDRAATQRFFINELGQWGTAPYFCEPWINRIIIFQHLYSPAMWSIFQLQDLMGSSATLRRENPQDERINIPANAKHYWRYRMHLTLEKLINETDFNTDLKDSIYQSGR